MTVEIITVLRATFPHTAVGQLSYVPVADTSRIDFKLVAKSRFLYETLPDAFTRRGAADIAEANK